MLGDAALTEAARYCDNDLALVLGERLEHLIGADEQLEDAQEQLEELQILYDRLVAENNALRDDMAE
jgi:succinylglutamate desuccinylase